MTETRRLSRGADGRATRYAIALGSNRRHGSFGPPEAVIHAALRELGGFGTVQAVSQTLRTAALGPAGRSFANAAALLECRMAPDALLAQLKAIERRFGRRPGRRWGPRVLDLDIILWSEGAYWDTTLVIPHPEMQRRRFVLAPLAEVVPKWRDPATGRTVRQLLARLTRSRPA